MDTRDGEGRKNIAMSATDRNELNELFTGECAPDECPGCGYRVCRCEEFEPSPFVGLPVDPLQLILGMYAESLRLREELSLAAAREITANVVSRVWGHGGFADERMRHG